MESLRLKDIQSKQGGEEGNPEEVWQWQAPGHEQQGATQLHQGREG